MLLQTHAGCLHDPVLRWKLGPHSMGWLVDTPRVRQHASYIYGTECLNIVNNELEVCNTRGSRQYPLFPTRHRYGTMNMLNLR